MDIPSPRALGFPAKMTEWRPAQLDAIEKILTSPKRVKVVGAPTGFGKTGVAVAVAKLSGYPTCIVTESRGLQDQYSHEFKAAGLVDIRGRANYTCDMRADYTCEDGRAARCPYLGTVACECSQAEIRAAVSPLVCTNYDKWTSSRVHSMGMSHFKQVIFDEGHEAPAALARAMQVTLSARELEKDLSMDPPSHGEELVNWKMWARDARLQAEDLMERARQQVKSVPNPKQAWIRHYLHLRNLVKKLSVIGTARPEHWVVEEGRDLWQFDPIRFGRYAQGALFFDMESIVLISATIRPKTLYQLGLSKDDFDFWEFPSDFPAGRCPIYYIPTMRVDARAGSLAPLWTKLDQVAARRTDRKGIVHTISYARRDEVLNTSRFSSSMLINHKGEASTAIIEQFRTAGPGTILVSPSVGAGYDFPGKDCEWQFVCKIPFPDGRPKILRARQEDDKEYGAYLAMNKLVQIFGRGMRSRTDQCENFIVDQHLDWFLPRFRHLAPRWFHNFFREVSVVPTPLRTL